MNPYTQTINEFVTKKNKETILFTAGPAALLPENITGLRPCFGRDDKKYDEIENRVLTNLKKMSGHNRLVRLQGSASLALEIAIANFLYGKVLVISSGYYSSRLEKMAISTKLTFKNIKKVDTISWEQIDKVSEKYDWILSCYTETSNGLKIPIKDLKRAASRATARLLLDATASIGLESGHELADVIAYSSCKGLFGLTGAAFIAHHELPTEQIDSFYLNWQSHDQKLMTGPYHSILSLDEVLMKHDEFRSAVVSNKIIFSKIFSENLSYAAENQPLLCTKLNKQIFSSNPNVVLYKPRTLSEGSVICHLGEVHLKQDAKGKIFAEIETNS